MFFAIVGIYVKPKEGKALKFVDCEVGKCIWTAFKRFKTAFKRFKTRLNGVIGSALGGLQTEAFRFRHGEIARITTLLDLLAAQLHNGAAGAAAVAAAALEEVELLVVLLDDGVVLLVDVEEGEDLANHGNERGDASADVAEVASSVFVVLAHNKAGATERHGAEGGTAGLAAAVESASRELELLGGGGRGGALLGLGSALLGLGSALLGGDGDFLLGDFFRHGC